MQIYRTAFLQTVVLPPFSLTRRPSPTIFAKWRRTVLSPTETTPADTSDA